MSKTAILTRGQVETFWQGPFSNWYKRPFKVQGVSYNCVEQWMMACKARVFGDGLTLHRIMLTSSPKDQKALGRTVAGYSDDIWQSVNEEMILVGALGKFTQHADLYKLLMGTEDRVLIEASPYDTVWGVGLAADDDRILDRSQWRGTNKQGKMLTRVRALLRHAGTLSKQD